MGAALTYARRYALFTLVGIAGEDDLDAPDITACGPGAGHEPNPRQDRFPPRESGNGRLRGATKGTTAVLDAGRSAVLRDKLLAEVASLTSADVAVTWATRTLPAKNSLIAADAKLLEDAFEQKLSGFPSPFANDVSAREGATATDVTSKDEPQASLIGSNESRGIDKSVLTVAAPRRYRNREHLRYVAQQPCLVCGRKPSDPHHLRHVQPRALGRKASDEFAVPLCRVHHRAVHRAGDERAWWKQAGIDPIKEPHARKRRSDRSASAGARRRFNFDIELRCCGEQRIRVTTVNTIIDITARGKLVRWRPALDMRLS
jgi:ERF superfamily protein